MPSAGWLVALILGCFLLGYGARAFLAWWQREEEREDEEFSRHLGAALTHLVADRDREAIEELILAARKRSDLAGVYMILGDLYRDQGEHDRAARIHASLLARSDISRAERAQAHTSLGEDHRAAGDGDRARECYRRALEADPRSLHALEGLRSYEIQGGRWSEAAELEERILHLDTSRSSRTLGFLHYEMGMEALRSDDEKAAMRAFQKAIAVDDHVHPAHLFMGDLHHRAGRTRKAVEQWERILELEPHLLHLVYDRLDQGYAELGEGDRLDAICHRVARRDPGDWRVRLLMGIRENERGNPEAAYGHLVEAARIQPGAVSVRREIWRITAKRGLDGRVARELSGIPPGPGPFVETFICETCRFRSRTYLWRCPQCQDWNRFVDEPVAGAPEEEAPHGAGHAEGMSNARHLHESRD